ncbi:hypothetical protein N9268_01405 [Akkermansiaceae bacterium]|nr:hypothetical protein [Akkermansiaceae bacterium]MDA8980924.1 hypothetical protein [bacterium]MDA8967084.1 hypothetical protein [Akkermansiaceae bacterium]MDB4421610.1 hypothetical protein [Akkermansiaceae bacterium]MDB4462388.1 hypothetical protein [Akkermansiaceae bacterium]
MDSDPRSGADPKFHKHSILGQLEIRDPKVIAQIHLELFKRIESQYPGNSYTMCYNPRHGLRIFRGEETRDFQICFECNHLNVFRNIEAEEPEWIGLETHPEELKLNVILDKAGIQRQEHLD